MSESENDVRHRINVTDIKDAILAEYNVLRGEIQHYHGERTTHMNFAVGVTVGLVALLGSERLTPESQSWMLALSPYFYAIIASLFLDRSIRIIRLADYIENDMRPRLEKLLQSPVWEWEKYKRETHRFPRWVPRCLDRLRLLVFVGPAGASWIAWFLQFRPTATALNKSLGFAAVVLILFIILINCLTQESSGASLRVREHGSPDSPYQAGRN